MRMAARLASVLFGEIALLGAGVPYDADAVLPVPKEMASAGLPVRIWPADVDPAMAVQVARADLAPLATAAKELRDRILDLAPGVTVRLVNGSADLAAANCVVRLEVNPALAAQHGEDSYRIESTALPRQSHVDVIGASPRAAYFGAQSLKQLFFMREGRLYLRLVRILDWPSFAIRSAYAYTAPGLAWNAFCKYNQNDVDYDLHGWNNWDLSQGSTAGWNVYSGAGTADIGTGEVGTGAVTLTIAALWTDPKTAQKEVNVALIRGQSDGYRGPAAFPALPAGTYRLEFAMRGTVPAVKPEILAWSTTAADAGARAHLLLVEGAVVPLAEWTHYEYRFDLPPTAQRFCPLLRVEGKQADGFDTGQWVAVRDLKLTTPTATEDLLARLPLPPIPPVRDYRHVVAELCAAAEPCGIEVCPMVNPLMVRGYENGGAKKIRISDPTQIDRLAATLALALTQGSKRAMLCLDDFTSSMKGGYWLTNAEDDRVFTSLGEAHGFLAAEVSRRLKQIRPEAELLVCPAYYWQPRGDYQEAGEKYLRAFGKLVPKDALIIWTGPGVRSRAIAAEDVARFAELIGRKPFLWDNTIYAHHDPPQYLFDPFDTAYPEGFAALTGGGVHNNGGHTALVAGYDGREEGITEVYRVGALTFADRLWNLEAYDPERSLRTALAMVAGPECVVDCLSFRDAYYALRDAQAGAALQPHREAIQAAWKTLAARSPNRRLVDELKDLMTTVLAPRPP